MNRVEFDKHTYTYIYFKQKGPSILDFFNINHNKKTGSSTVAWSSAVGSLRFLNLI